MYWYVLAKQAETCSKVASAPFLARSWLGSEKFLFLVLSGVAGFAQVSRFLKARRLH